MSAKPRIRFSVIGLNHYHVYMQIDSLLKGGGELVSCWAKEPELRAVFKEKYPDAKLASSEKEVLEDETIQLVTGAGIPNERAPIGIRVMQHGKDYLVDKAGFTDLGQLAEARKVQKETKRIYSVYYVERLESASTIHAAELARKGAIGKVVQTIGLGPHQLNAPKRPDWFFRKAQYGGILTDIASHQADQFLYLTGSTKAEVKYARVANNAHPEFPELEDFGEANFLGDGGSGYIRVDWYTPDGLKTWGDGRLIVLGTEGYIEVRKYADIAHRPGEDHLIVVDKKETRYVNCQGMPLPFGEQLVFDVVNRTETANDQELCFLASELALKAQAMAEGHGNSKKS
ncbi:MAG: Gfo/Idh/MocA family protein [Parvibaculaceae bacterium]